VSAGFDDAHRPYTLVAELTYRCPLRCAYCSNPVELGQTGEELETAAWRRVIDEAAALGVMQVHFTGGEPALRDDLPDLVAHARRQGLYTHLVTSGVPLDRARLQALREAGLEAVQLSFQDLDRATARRITGVEALDHKLQVAAWIKQVGLPLTLNVVLHRENLARTGDFIALAERAGAERLELANTTYLGWAEKNRDALLPSRPQLEAAHRQATEARERLAGRLEIVFVVPDYVSKYPRACMDGWARRFVVVAPDGLVLPCHQARTLAAAGLSFESVRDRSLAEIWTTSPALQRFRGHAWMPEPCQGCERRDRDFGGCRCQAFALTGDAAATDPACSLAPTHDLVVSARQRAAAVDEASHRGHPLPVLELRHHRYGQRP
jgi:pyrroloquinoline quinone biosynthesis protein E